MDRIGRSWAVFFFPMRCHHAAFFNPLWIRAVPFVWSSFDRHRSLSCLKYDAAVPSTNANCKLRRERTLWGSFCNFNSPCASLTFPSDIQKTAHELLDPLSQLIATHPTYPPALPLCKHDAATSNTTRRNAHARSSPSRRCNLCMRSIRSTRAKGKPRSRRRPRGASRSKTSCTARRKSGSATRSSAGSSTCASARGKTRSRGRSRSAKRDRQQQRQHIRALLWSHLHRR